MPRSVKKFIPTHNTSTVDAKTRFRNVSERVELQIPFVLHRSYKLRRSGEIIEKIAAPEIIVLKKLQHGPTYP